MGSSNWNQRQINAMCWKIALALGVVILTAIFVRPNSSVNAPIPQSSPNFQQEKRTFRSEKMGISLTLDEGWVAHEESEKHFFLRHQEPIPEGRSLSKTVISISEFPGSRHHFNISELSDQSPIFFREKLKDLSKKKMDLVDKIPFRFYRNANGVEFFSIGVRYASAGNIYEDMTHTFFCKEKTYWAKVIRPLSASNEHLVAGVATKHLTDALRCL